MWYDSPWICQNPFWAPMICQGLLCMLGKQTRSTIFALRKTSHLVGTITIQCNKCYNRVFRGPGVRWRTKKGYQCQADQEKRFPREGDFSAEFWRNSRREIGEGTGLLPEIKVEWHREVREKGLWGELHNFSMAEWKCKWKGYKRQSWEDWGTRSLTWVLRSLDRTMKAWWPFELLWENE